MNSIHATLRITNSYDHKRSHFGLRFSSFSDIPVSRIPTQEPNMYSIFSFFMNVKQGEIQ